VVACRRASLAIVRLSRSHLSHHRLRPVIRQLYAHNRLVCIDRSPRNWPRRREFRIFGRLVILWPSGDNTGRQNLSHMLHCSEGQAIYQVKNARILRLSLLCYKWYDGTEGQTDGLYAQRGRLLGRLRKRFTLSATTEGLPAVTLSAAFFNRDCFSLSFQLSLTIRLRWRSTATDFSCFLSDP